MTKFEKLMPVSHIVKAFCKAMKSLIEDEVVVNDMECQLKAEMVRVSEEIPRIIFLKGKEEDVCIIPNQVAWIEADGSYVRFHMTNGRKELMSCNLQSVLNQLYEVGIDYFVRIHYSHAVNLYHIKSRSGNVLFVGRKDLAVSDKYRKDFSKYYCVIRKRP